MSPYRLHVLKSRLTAATWLLIALVMLLSGGSTMAWLRGDEKNTTASSKARANAAKEERVAKEEPDYQAELPRIAPLAPGEALASFRLSSDLFAIDQVAAEPHVASPVALDFDADGRMFVVEMRDYSEQDKERLGRVRLLEDVDNDGRFERSTVFADDLSWPTAVACANGGVYVGAAPHIYFLKDDDGDGRADTRKVVFTGFSRDNVQGLLNSFQWGLDNRLHGATSTAAGEVRRADDSQAKPLSLRGRDFSIDTRTLAMRAESGGGQHGMSFDEWGRKFVCSNSDHIQLILAEDRYLARNAFLAVPAARVSIAADGPQAEVFRTSPVEPWRVLRTRLRVAGEVPGPIEGGGRAAGYFTGATGATIYRGDAWPAEFRGNAFIGDVGSNIVHRKTLSADGLLLFARRAEAAREFLASRDIWFRPAQFANAPEGNLYVIDVYREVIEHPASLPPAIKKHLDLTSGRDRGRIYRIRPKAFQQPPVARLSRAGIAELVALLEHTNGWHRQTASRLLYERNDKAAVPLLIALARDSNSPLGRMHALRALDGLDALTPDAVLAALGDEHPGVRRHAVQLSERMLDSENVRSALAKMNNDEDLLVRYQLAFTLGELPPSERLTPLAAIARRDAEHPWMRIAVQSSLATGAGELLSDLLRDVAFCSTEHGEGFIRALAREIGMQNDREAIARLAAAIESLSKQGRDELADVIALAAVEGASTTAAGSGTRRAVLGHSAISRSVARAISQAREAALDAGAIESARSRAIETLALAPFNENRETFVRLLAADQPHAVQLAAVTVIARMRDESGAALLLEAWPSLTPRLRALALDGLTATRSTTNRLLDAIDAGTVARGQIDPARVGQLLRHRDETVRERAKDLFRAAYKRDRDAIVQRYQDALTRQGSADKGRAVFRKFCAGCHRAEGEGHEHGPSLATVQNRGAEAILLNILDPNREVNPQYVSYVAVTKDGRSATGMIAGESATSIVLARGEGITETILRSEIDELTSTGLSLMPEGFETQIDVPSMADLLAYLITLK